MTTRRSILGLVGAVPLTVGTGVAAGAVTGSGRPAGRRSVPPDLRPGGALDRFAAEQAAADEFSGSLLVTHRGRTVLSRSYGMANKEQSVPNRPETRFGLASVTKLFTAVAVAQLAQAGKVAYGGKLGSYLDGFPADIADRVQVHHLLTHTSGLGDHHTPEYWEIAKTWTSAEQVMDGTTDFIRRTAKLEFAPGAGHRYSNSGFHLLGAIVAKASGRLYYDYVREHIFEAADMTGTDFYTKPERYRDKRIARPYKTLPSGERVDALDQHMFIGTPAGDALSTCRDLERFADALLGERLLEPAFRDLTLGGKRPMGPPQPPPERAARREPPPPVAFQGFGPIVSLVNGGWTFGHGGGSTNGASTAFEVYPELGLVMVFLSNYQPRAVEPLASMARRIIVEHG